MDQRDIEDILYNLNSEKDVLLSKLDEIDELLEDEKKTKEEIEDLKEEKETVEYDIQEISLDIAMYTEMMDKLYPSEVGACGLPCDGRCQQCEGYEPLYEVFTAGDY
jgi:chromosome segregation ATPase